MHLSDEKIASVIDTAKRRRSFYSLGAAPSDGPDSVADLEAVVIALAEQLADMGALVEPKPNRPEVLMAVSSNEIIGSYWATDSAHGGSWRFSRQELSGPPGVDVVPLTDARKLNTARQQIARAKGEASAARQTADLRMRELKELGQEIAELRENLLRERQTNAMLQFDAKQAHSGGAPTRSGHDIRMGKLHDLPDNIKSIRIDRDTNTVVIEEELTIAPTTRSCIINCDFDEGLRATLIGDRYFIHRDDRDPVEAHAEWADRQAGAAFETAHARIIEANGVRVTVPSQRRLRSEPGRVTSEENRSPRSVVPQLSDGAA